MTKKEIIFASIFPPLFVVCTKKTLNEKYI